MKKSLIYIFAAFAAIGCDRQLNTPDIPKQEIDPTEINLNCRMTGMHLSDNEQVGTKSIIGKPVWEGLSCNFIKVDEPRVNEQASENYVYKDDYIKFNEAVIANASVNSADNASLITHAGYDYMFREIRLDPVLSYQFTVPQGEEITQSNVTGFASAMVGWYPATENVAQGGTGSNTLFRSTKSYYIDTKGNVCVAFKNMLDGETDIMVSDLREGRFNKKATNFRNNPDPEKDKDIQPFGYLWTEYNSFENGFEYLNYFTFKHYLTAVRLYLTVSDANLSLLSWGNINDVVFTNQPSTAIVQLPTSQARGDENTVGPVTPIAGTTPTLPSEGVKPNFGKVVEWADPVDMKIRRDGMTVEDPDPEHENLNKEVPDYPISTGQGTSLDRKYLGYCLLQPDVETAVELHTDAGIIIFKIPTKAFRHGEKEPVEILKEGVIYDLNITVNTKGNIEVVVGNRDKDYFRDLAPFNTVTNRFEDSNCYVINKDMMTYTDKETGVSRKVDGFYFHAYTPGRGEIGNIASAPYPGNMIFSPSYMEILWQDETRPLTSIELVNGYCRFTLNDKCYSDGLEGNAVIAAYDDDDNIIWSWHIWITSQLEDIEYKNVKYRSYKSCAPNAVKGGLDLTSPFYGDVTGSSEKTIEFSMMNMNLGATKAYWTGTDDVLDTYGLYYQWGRKDPSLGPETYNYDIKSLSTRRYLTNNGWSNTVYEHLENFPTVQTGIENPLALIDPMMRNLDYGNDWLYESVNDLWGYDLNQKEVTKKTIYDPCPYGYRVPDEELNALFYAAGKKNSPYNYWNATYGMVIEGGSEYTYFPYTGWKGHIKGRSDRTHGWWHVGDMADYQDARISHFTSTDYFGYKFHRGATILSEYYISILYDNKESFHYYAGISPGYANRTTAAPVRCVRYNAPGEEPAD